MLEGDFLIQQELSSSIINAVPQLQNLLNNDKQIYFPLKVTGKGADVKFSVDTEYIAAHLIGEEAAKEIYKAIDKVFGQKDAAGAAQSAPPEGQDKQTDIKNAVNDILKGVIK